MTFPNFKDRRFSNKVIAAVVLLHFVTLMMAARFDQPWLIQLAMYGTLTLISFCCQCFGYGIG